MAKTLKFDNGVVNLGTSVSGAVGAISAGANSVGAGTVVFSNSNGVTFGLNGSTVTASVAAGGGGGIAASANGSSQGAGTVVWSNSNNVSFGMNGSTITATVTTPAETPFGVSAGTQSVSTGTLVFSNSNGITFGMSGSSRLTASHNGLTAGIQSLSAGTTRATAGEVVLSNSNGLTFGLNGATITGSYTVPTQTPFGISAGTQSVSTGTLVFSNSNGITFGMSGSSRITASHDGITSQSNQQLTLFATGNTTQSSTGTSNASSLIFRGEGIASVGITNGSVVLSVPNGAPSPVNVSAGTTSGDLGNIVFSNSNGVSFGLNGSTITASMTPHVTESYYAPYADRLKVIGQQGQGTLHINPLPVPGAFQFDSVWMPVYNTNSSNSSGSHTLSFWVGLYTKNASTLSLAHSGSASYALTHSGTAGSYSLYSAYRNLSVPMTATITDGDYWIGVLSRTTSGGANGSYSHALVSDMASNFVGIFGSSHATTYQQRMGQGIYTATTSDLPTSIGFSQIRGSNSLAFRPPVVFFASGTA